MQGINEKPRTSSVNLTDEKPCLIVEVVCVFAHHEVSSDVETSANNVHFPVSETDSRMQPVVMTAARQTTVTIKLRHYMNTTYSAVWNFFVTALSGILSAMYIRSRVHVSRSCIVYSVTFVNDHG